MPNRQDPPNPAQRSFASSHPPTRAHGLLPEDNPGPRTRGQPCDLCPRSYSHLPSTPKSTICPPPQVSHLLSSPRSAIYPPPQCQPFAFSPKVSHLPSAPRSAICLLRRNQQLTIRPGSAICFPPQVSHFLLRPELSHLLSVTGQQFTFCPEECHLP